MTVVSVVSVYTQRRCNCLQDQVGRSHQLPDLFLDAFFPLNSASLTLNVGLTHFIYKLMSVINVYKLPSSQGWKSQSRIVSDLGSGTPAAR